jgi:hypothetical protein
MRPRVAIGLEAILLLAIVQAGPGSIGASVAKAQGLDPKLWITDGPVYATARSGKTLYIGGRFGQVGFYTGGGVPLAAIGGLPTPGFPRVRGSVRAIAADGTGGWFIGGQFDSVGGIPRKNLAHIQSDLTVSAWNPGADGRVLSIAVRGGTVYAGGGFGNAGGQARSCIVALDAQTGLATDWNPGANNSVWTLAVSGTTVYTGGDFTSIGGAARSYIAAVDVSTGAVTAWNPAANNWLNALALSGSIVYAAGNFTSIGGQTRNRIAALDTATGLATAWDPNANGAVMALALDGNTVYAGGRFYYDSRLPPYATIGGQTRNGIAALDATTGAATPWNPDLRTTVYALAISGGTVYAGADYGPLAALDAVTGQATWNRSVNYRIWALSANADVVYMGGEFTSLGVQRSKIAALDTDTGQATAWNPGMATSPGEVRALAVSGGKVYVGGTFSYPGQPTIGGQPRNFIAAVDSATGLATEWNPDANSTVFTLAVDQGVVYAGGFFTSIGGQPRNRIAALDVASGLATAWNPDANNIVEALALVGNTVYAGGTFTSIGGQARNRIAALDGTTGTATDWNPNASSVVGTLAVSGSTVYAGGTFTAIGGQPRNRVAALGIADGLATSWDPNANGSVRCLAVSGGTVYAGGFFSGIGGQARSRIASLDATTGLASAWNPSADSTVWTLALGDGTLYAGGDFTILGGQTCPYLAGVLKDFPTATLLSTFTADWRAGAIELTWSFADVVGVTSVRVERAPHPGGPWAECAIEVRSVGALTAAVDRDVQEGTTYWYRLVAIGAGRAPAIFGPIAATAGRRIREFSLGPPSPNPSAGAVRVEFEVPRKTTVRLRVLDVQGREVATLANADQEPGLHQVLWDGRGSTSLVPAGIYFLRLDTPEGARTRRIVVVR